MDANEKEQSEIVEFIYLKNKDYKVHYVHGAQGELTPSGDIKIDLFIEYLPSSQVDIHEILENGQFGPIKEQQRPAVNKIIREKMVGLIMSPDTVKNLADWLIKKVELYDTIQKQSGKEATGNEPS